MIGIRLGILASVTALVAAGLSCSLLAQNYAPPPAYDHIVIVVEENHSAYQLGGCAYLNSLAARGTRFANMHALVHPSQPNYIALFSGSLQGITDDALHTISAPSVYDRLLAAGRSFYGYSEGLPSVGFTGESDGRYVRRHAPWVSFTSVPGSANRPFTDFPSGASPDFTVLPSLAYVIPNLDHDMHDGSITQGDDWLAQNLEAYASWATGHNSLLIVTFDEPYGSEAPAFTPILTIMVGAGIIPGSLLPDSYTLYSLLRLVDDSFGLSPLGYDATVQPITGPWG